MLRKLNPRRSPALIVAVIALIAALGGSAIAAGGLSGKQKKQVRKIADKEISKKAGGLSVSHAGTADSATNASHASTADVAGGPVAVAYIDNGGPGGIDFGHVNAGQSRGIAQSNVSSPSAGSYCFNGLGFAFKGANVTTDYSTSTDYDIAQVDTNPSDTASTGDCTGDQLEVDIGDTTGTAADSGFYIAFYN